MSAVQAKAAVDSPAWEWADAWAALVVFLVALAVRLVYLGEIQDVPFFEFPIMDAKTYDAWAVQIASGDWLGQDVFYQAPAYPYLLAVLYAVFGHDPGLAHGFMMVLGSISCVLLFLATRVLFFRAAGLAAGLLIAVYPMAFFFDGQIGKTGLALFLMSGLLFTLLSYQRSWRLGWVFIAGIVLGLLALTRENALVFVLVIPLWMVWRIVAQGCPWTRALSAVACFGIGVVLVIGPVALRNQSIGGSFELTTAQLGPNFFIGNNPDATGLYEPLLPGRHTPEFESPDATMLAEEALGRPLTRGEVSDFWLQRGLTFVLEQPGAWFQLLVYKFLLTWNDYEIADTEDIYVYADWSVILRGLLPYFGFGVLVTLGAAGFVLAWPQRRDMTLLVALMLTFSAAVALFMVFGRMRFPLVPLLVPLAGYTLAGLPRTLREGHARRVAAAALVGGLAAFVAHLPLAPEEALRANGYANLGAIMLNESRNDEAEVYLERAQDIYAEQSDLQYALALLRFRQQRFEDSEAHLRHMLRLERSDYRGHLLLATVLRRQGQLREAQEHRVRGRELAPRRPKVRDAPMGSR